MTVDKITKTIDRIHETCFESIRKKNLSSYMSVFDKDVTYKQYNGQVVGKSQLANDQKRYFSRIKSVKNSYERIDWVQNYNRFSETLIQQAEISIRVFIFFKKTWKVVRKGIYDWSNISGEWKIVKVNILEEKIK